MNDENNCFSSFCPYRRWEASFMMAAAVLVKEMKKSLVVNP